MEERYAPLALEALRKCSEHITSAFDKALGMICMDHLGLEQDGDSSVKQLSINKTTIGQELMALSAQDRQLNNDDKRDRLL